MQFTDRLYKKAKPIWRKSHDHPFVQGIGHGTLDIEKFKFFMQQDYLYLIDYARLFALGSLKGTDLKTMSIFAKLLDSTLNVEMDLHRQYASRLGISEAELEATKAAPTTLAYSGYMLNVSQRGSLADLVAAVLPCTWSYYEIGTELSKIPGALENETYGEWVKMYASEEFGELADWLITLMNELAEGKTEAELTALEEIFLNTSRYEYMFWDMSYNLQMWPTDDEQ
ncbi:thiaminase II [Alkalihalobacterium chitinilyticum]|uniref:Aminopyrimidine aminohydrolase n=1 Tax=Alkalihalobacterium chitinilyticum TaxID=2980103 RepID=A0ABT5VCJ1_9BACI|nr:thiaminase II [Alkalihalobacterium chitinilyticum]MDE5413166.1 thiaminase II [Alkalihalobacterium chitinilyticum]